MSTGEPVIFIPFDSRTSLKTVAVQRVGLWTVIDSLYGLDFKLIFPKTLIIFVPGALKKSILVELSGWTVITWFFI